MGDFGREEGCLGTKGFVRCGGFCIQCLEDFPGKAQKEKLRVGFTRYIHYFKKYK